jgi:predicted helicase
LIPIAVARRIAFQPLPSRKCVRARHSSGSGTSAVGFVVPHTVLDAPTFSAVRRSLMLTFDEFYALDLHGNQRKRETAPDGSRDENLFPGVAQGVAILVLVKMGGLWFLCRLFPFAIDAWRAAGRPER